MTIAIRDERPAARPAGASHLTRAQVDELGRELDAIRAEVMDSLGAADAAYIKRVIQMQRMLEVGGRALLLGARRPAAFVVGTGMLALSKVLENMEIGHNVIHGQWDWMRDPDIHSTTWEWDFVAPAKGWKHTHNDVHHTWTNVVGAAPDSRRDNMGMVGRATAGMDYTLYRLFYTGVGANRTGFSNARVDELLRLGRGTTDAERQKAIYGEVQQIIWDEAPFVFLWYQKQALGVSKAVRGLEVRPDETMLFHNITIQR